MKTNVDIFRSFTKEERDILRDFNLPYSMDKSLDKAHFILKTKPRDESQVKLWESIKNKYCFTWVNKYLKP
jgi:hypothetical protein